MAADFLPASSLRAGRVTQAVRTRVHDSTITLQTGHKSAAMQRADLRQNAASGDGDLMKKVLAGLFFTALRQRGRWMHGGKGEGSARHLNPGEAVRAESLAPYRTAFPDACRFVVGTACLGGPFT